MVTRALPFLLIFAFLIYCLVDCFQTPEERVRNLPKVVWILLILLIPLVGGVVWLIAGRTRGSGGTRGPRPGPSGGRGPRGAPDDDDDFLRGLK